MLTTSATLAAYTFLLTATLRLGCTGAPESIYYAQQAVLALGFLSYALSRRVLREPKPRKALAASAIAVYAISAAALFLTRNPYAALAAVFCIGHLGGLVYHRLSETLNRNKRLGVTIGAGCAAAYILQFAFQSPGTTAFLPAAMLTAFVALVWLLRRKEELPVEQQEAFTAEPQDGDLTVSLACACVVTAALVMLGCWYDGYLAQMQAATDYGAYGWPRLLLVPFCLLFGFLGDWKGGKYLSLAAFCVALVTLLNPVLALGGGSYDLNLCLFYVGVAAAISYYHITFCRLAPQTRHPALWAGMGRVIDATMVAALGLMRYSRSPAAVATAFDLAILAVIAVVLMLYGDLSLAPRGETKPVFAPAGAPAAFPAGEDIAVTRLSERYGLSGRETEVLREWLYTEDTRSVIAGRMFISPDTLHGHINALYRKTGQHTRKELRDLARELSGEGS